MHPPSRTTSARRWAGLTSRTLRPRSSTSLGPAVSTGLIVASQASRKAAPAVSGPAQSAAAVPVRALDGAGLPSVGGERPHIQVRVDLATLLARTGPATLDWAGPLT